MSEVMKPCPFCGGEADHTFRDNTGATADWCGPRQWWAYCDGPCSVTVGFFETEAEAIAAWNTRHTIEAQAAEIERLQDALIRASRDIQGYKDALAQVGETE